MSSKNLAFGNIFFPFADNRNMIINGKEFFTVKDMADILDLHPTVVKQRLFTADKHPITKDALYEADALEAIRNVPGKGRPAKKPKLPEP
jgi:predicted ArsR family transcriptional regulator